MNRDDVLAAVSSQVSYLRAATTAPTDEGWIACADLVAGGGGLRELILETGRGRGTDDLQVAASLFVQAYAFRVASVVLGAYALGLPIVDVAPEHTAIRIARDRPAAIAHTLDAVHEGSVAELVARLIDGHLAAFIASVRTLTPVGERLLWGNAATSCAVVFRAIEGVDHDPSVRARAAKFFAAASPIVDGLGGFETLQVGDREGWYWTRTNCCLWYQTTAERRCDDCSLYSEAELRIQRKKELAEVAE